MDPTSPSVIYFLSLGCGDHYIIMKVYLSKGLLFNTWHVECTPTTLNLGVPFMFFQLVAENVLLYPIISDCGSPADSLVVLAYVLR